MFLIFFFKQKTAYEMRISDWSSDVCSSDLRVLPDQILARHFRPQIADLRTHVAMGELEPRTRECIGELVGVPVEPLGGFAIGRVGLERHVGRGHHRRHTTVGAVRPRTTFFRLMSLRPPLPSGRRAFHHLYFIFHTPAEKVYC